MFSKLVSVSRDCGYTRQLHQILNNKLTNEELDVFAQWLNIVKEETDKNSKDYARRNGLFY